MIIWSEKLLVFGILLFVGSLLLFIKNEIDRGGGL